MHGATALASKGARAEVVMGRAERRERRRQRRWAMEQEGLEGDGLEESGVAAGLEEAGEVFERAEWSEEDVLEAKPEGSRKGPDPWEAVQLGTVLQVADLFRVHWKTVERWRRTRGLPCIRPGGVIRYDLGAVMEWARRDTEGGRGAEATGASLDVEKLEAREGGGDGAR